MNVSSPPALAEETHHPARRSLPWPMIGATVAVLAAAFALQLAVYGHRAVVRQTSEPSTTDAVLSTA